MGLKERLIDQKKIAAQKAVLYSKMNTSSLKVGLSQKLKISRSALNSHTK